LHIAQRSVKLSIGRGTHSLIKYLSKYCAIPIAYMTNAVMKKLIT
jgi:hypothetical protein